MIYQACNGVYTFDSSQHRDPRTAVYTKDSSHQLYRVAGVWHIAYSSVAVFYLAHPGQPGSPSALPPLVGWKAVTGAKPVPTLTMQNVSVALVG